MIASSSLTDKGMGAALYKLADEMCSCAQRGALLTRSNAGSYTPKCAPKSLAGNLSIHNTKLGHSIRVQILLVNFQLGSVD